MTDISAVAKPRLTATQQEKIAFLTEFAKAYRDFNGLLLKTSELFHEVEEYAEGFDELLPCGGFPIEAFGTFHHRHDGMMFFQTPDGQIIPICQFEFLGDAISEATGLNYRYQPEEITNGQD